MPKYLSGRSKLTRQSGLTADRYRYLSIENAEPNLGDPLVGLSSVTAKPTPPGQQFIVVSVEGSEPGERYWIPNQGGIIPGSISVFDDNTLVGALSSITQLNFVGAAITASVSIASSNLATIRVFSPGNNQEIIFNTANEFSTSTKLKFDPSNGLLTAGDRIIVGAGGTVITTTGVGSVGIGTTNPTQELHLQGDLRLTGTIYDSNNQPGTDTQLLIKNNFGGLNWINQGTIRAGAGGTYSNIQFHNNAGLVDGAPNFVFDEVNSRVGIGSTQPKVLLDVLGISSFKGGTTIDNLNVTGFTTTSTLAVSGTSTTRNLLVTGIATITNVNIDAGEIDVTRIETQNLKATGITTVGFVTGTSAFFTGIVTATKFVGGVDVSQLYVTGISTFLQKVNINSDLGVTGLTTTQNLQVYQSTTLNRLNVSGIGTFSSQLNVNNINVTGVGTFDNIKLDSNTISTNVGNLILDSSAGTTQINDAIYVNDATESTSKDGGSIVTEGGVGIEKNLNVGGQLNVGGATTLASLGGITTTGGDLYVKGNLYVSNDIFYDELFARNGYFTGITSTKDLNVTGIATIARLGVTGLTTTRDLQVTGFSTFTNTIDANGGAYIDNIQIGISGDNEIDTSTGNLILDSAGGTVEITDQLTVSGITTISNTTDSTNKDTGALIVEGGVGIEKNLNVGGNVTLGDATSDTVTFNSRINSSVLPSTNGTLDLGGTSNRWSVIYATTFNGAVVGNADSASQVSAGTTTGTTTYFPTFVDSNNSTRGNEFLYTDAGISYNPSIDLLTAGNLGVSGLTTTRNLIVSGISTFEGLLDANAGATIDNIQIGISGDNEIDTSTGNLILDSAGGTTTLDDNVSIIGNLTVSGISTFQGNVTIGDANTDKVSFGATVDSNIIPSGTTRDLGSSSNKWNNVYANTFVGAITGNADTATKLATARNFSIDGNNNTSINAGDVSAATVSFDGSANVILRGSLKNVTGLSAETYGNSITVPVVSVNSQGIVTSITSVGVNFSTATVANADKVAAVTRSTNATHYLTFVDSDNNPAAYDSLYTDAGISYNPSTDLLTATNLTVTTTSTFNGNVTLGDDANVDTVTFTSKINSNVLPSTNASTAVDVNGKDLGGTSNYWRKIYAREFDGQFIGNADTATRATVASILSPKTTSPYTTIDTQGSYIHWNRKNSDGATWLINQRGAGAGGFYFAESTSNALNVTEGTVGLTTTLVINSSGDITPKGDFIGRLTNTMLTGTDTTELIRGNMANNDYFRILVGGTATDAGYVELATSDNATEPIYVRQYTGEFSSLQRTASLLDNAGDTRFPGTVYAAAFNGPFTSNLNVTGISTFDSTVRFKDNIELDATKTMFFGKEESFGGTDTGGGDYGYITWDNDNDTYRITDSGENGCLRIGTQNDGEGGVSDNMALEPAASLYLNPGANGDLYKGNASNKQIIWYGSGTGGNISTNSVTLSESLRANVNINGGGTITVSASGSVKWGDRFIVISNGNGSNFSTNGYFDIFCPLSGTIIGVGGASNVTATSDGIPLSTWQALYYILPLGSSNSSLADNFRVASYTSNLDIPYNWVLICIRNEDDGKYYFPSRGTAALGTSIGAGSGGNATTATRANYADNAGISTNLKGGAAYQIPYQSAADTTLFIPNGSTTGQLLQYNSGSAPSWVTPSGLSVSRADYATKAGLATDLEINATNRVLYQASNNNTDVLPAGDSGQLLQSNGTSAPSWVTPSNLTAGKSDVAVQLSPRSSSDYRIIDTQGTYIHWNRNNGDGATWLINQRGLGAGGFYFADSTSSASNTFGSTTGLTQTMSLSANGLLTVNAIKPTQIQDTGGGTGTANYVLTANGSGGWSWSSVTGGGSPAIAGITIQEEGSTVGTQLGITTVNFIGGSVTATSPTAGTANISITAAADSTFAAGTRLMFAQASAPDGWTRVTDDSANNRMLRVVSSGGGGTGGSADPILNNVVAAHTHSFTTGGFNNDIDHLHSGNTGNVSNDHNHTLLTRDSTANQGTGQGANQEFAGGGGAQGSVLTNGINQNHFHGFTTNGADRSLNHTHSGSTDNGSSQTNWAPRYIDMILCYKN